MSRRVPRPTATDRTRSPITSHPPVPIWKRPLDWALILVTAPLWLPVALLCTIWIKLVSKGSVLYRQERIGYRGKRFVIFKFRTMAEGSDTAVHDLHLQNLIESNRPMTKLDREDPRLIPGAKFLRASGLDELPQLLNVIRGEMSLVGPRPCTQNELKKYKPSYHRRFNGLPGITGSWQVNGKNKTSFRKMIALDIHYLRNALLLWDLAIIMRTFPTILGQVLDARRRQLAVPQNLTESLSRNPRPLERSPDELTTPIPFAPSEGTAPHENTSPIPPPR